MRSIIMCGVLALASCNSREEVEQNVQATNLNGHNAAPGVFIITLYAPDGKTISQSRARSYSYNVGWCQFVDENNKAVVTNATFTIEHQ